MSENFKDVSMYDILKLTKELKGVMNVLAGTDFNTVTHAQMISLIQRGRVRTGQLYLITDFRTKHQIPYTTVINQGEVEPLIVMGISVTGISGQAWSTLFPLDFITYDITDVLCEDGKTARTGKITSRRDENFNETPYDFRAVKFRRWELIAPEWDDSVQYAKGRLVSYSGKYYKFGACGLYETSTEGLCPVEDVRWKLYYDPAILNTTHIYPTGVIYTDGRSNVGGILGTGLSLGEYTDFYTFSDKDGEQRSAWFRNCKIGKVNDVRLFDGTLVREDAYNNIVFIETQDSYSYNNNFVGMCFDLTLSANTRNNSFTNSVYSSIWLGSCFNNVLVAWSYNLTGTGCSENHNVSRMWAGNLMGSNFTGNTILGEGVWNSIGNGFAQNVMNHDFTHNIVGDGFHYNNVESDCWDNHFLGNVADNHFGAHFQANFVGYGIIDCDFATGTMNSRFPKNMNTVSVHTGTFNGVNLTGPTSKALVEANVPTKVTASTSKLYIETVSDAGVKVFTEIADVPEIEFAILTKYEAVQKLWVKFSKPVASIDTFFILYVTEDEIGTNAETGVIIASDPSWVCFTMAQDVTTQKVINLHYTPSGDPVTFTDETTLGAVSGAYCINMLDGTSI